MTSKEKMGYQKKKRDIMRSQETEESQDRPHNVYPFAAKVKKRYQKKKRDIMRSQETEESQDRPHNLYSFAKEKR